MCNKPVSELAPSLSQARPIRHGSPALSTLIRDGPVFFAQFLVNLIGKLDDFHPGVLHGRINNSASPLCLTQPPWI